MKSIVYGVIFVVAFLLVYALKDRSSVETFVDSRDNHKYTVVRIGEQAWLAENISIKLPKSYCYGNAASCEKNGRLYTRKAAMEACPYGWGVPTDVDWQKALAKAGSWVGLHKMGLKIPMAGDRRSDGAYHYLGESAFFWSATRSKKKFIRYKFDMNSEAYDRSEMVDGPAYSLKCVQESKSCKTPLFNAIRSGDVSKASSLIASGAHVNATCETEDKSEMTSLGEYAEDEAFSPLGLAIDMENIEMVRLLLERGADANAVDVGDPNYFYSMIHRAMSKNNRDIIKLLLDYGAKPEFCDVVWAADSKTDILKMVVKKMDVVEMNQCWYGQSLADLFSSKPDVQNLIIKRGAKSGAVICPSKNGRQSKKFNTRPCSD